jgi:hypothetical protein
VRYLLLYAGTPVGRVELAGPDPAVGWLEPLPAYAAVRDTFRPAGDALWAYGRARRPAVGLVEGAAG